MNDLLQEVRHAVRALITARFPLHQALQPLGENAGGIKNVIAIGT